MMKSVPFILTLLISSSVMAQFPEVPMTNGFAKGTVVLSDSSVKKGWLNWKGTQNAKLVFKETEEGDTVHYDMPKVLSFRVSPNHYKRMNNIQVYAHEWGMYGKLTTIKESFAQVVNIGRVNIYAFRYNGIDKKTDVFLHNSLVFERKTAAGLERAPFPAGLRVTEEQFEKAKAPALKFFVNYPQITELIRKMKGTDPVYELVQLVREIE